MIPTIIVGGQTPISAEKSIWYLIKDWFIRHFKAYDIHIRPIQLDKLCSIQFAFFPPIETWEKMGNIARVKTYKHLKKLLCDIPPECIIIENHIQEILNSAKIFSSYNWLYKETIKKLKINILPEIINLCIETSENTHDYSITIINYENLNELKSILGLITKMFRHINLYSDVTYEELKLCEVICEESGTSIHVTSDFRIIERTDILLDVGNSYNDDMYDITKGIKIILDSMQIIKGFSKWDIKYCLPDDWIKRIGRSIVNRFDNACLTGFFLNIVSRMGENNVNDDIYKRFVEKGFSLELVSIKDININTKTF